MTDLPDDAIQAQLRALRSLVSERFDTFDARQSAQTAAVSVRLERLDAAHERGLLAIERRLGAIEDALSDWAAHYWAHEEHPPRPT